MALSEASIIQKNQGFFDAASGAASLANGTTAGSTVILIAFTPQEAGNNALVIPDGFQQDFEVGSASARVAAYSRADAPTGETSWTIRSLTGLADLVMWFSYEMTWVDLIGPVDQPIAAAGTSVTSLSTGTTPMAGSDDLMCIAVHTTKTITTIGSQTNGFVETEAQSQTSASHGSGAISISRLFPGAAGQFECTATFGAAVTALAGLLVYRAVGELPVDPGGQVLAG